MADLYRAAPPLPPDAHYAARRTCADRGGILAATAEAWRPAESISWGPARYLTTFRALWTAEALAIRFDARDDTPWHVRTHHDDCLWEEEVVEMFLDPTCSGANYAEVEISPANVVCDLRVISPWPALASDRAWDWKGLETRVQTQERDETGVTWCATAWLPWDGLRSLSSEACARVPPRDGDRWRLNVFRIKRPGGPGDPERGAIYAAWSVPSSGPSFHAPEAFRNLVFVG